MREGVALLGQVGFNGLTVQALAERCAMSKAGILRYYPSKDAILIGVLGELERHATATILPVLDAIRAGKDGSHSTNALRTILRLIVAPIIDQWRVALATSMLQAEALDPSHPAHSWFAAREQAALAFYEELAATFAAHPRSTARQVHAVQEGLINQWLRGGRGFDLFLEWERAMDAILPPETPGNVACPVDKE